MSTAAVSLPIDQPAAAEIEEDIPLIISRRQDLLVHEYRDGIETVWVIKDPISLRYFRFSPQEFAIFDMLNGHRTIGEVRTEYRKHFFPRELDLQQLRRFIDRLIKAGLVIIEKSGRGQQFAAMAARKKKWSFVGRFMNVVAFKFPGFHPRLLLDVVDPWFRPFASRIGVSIGFMLIISAVVLAVVRWEAMVQRLPLLSQFFALKNVLLIMASFAVVKIIHELGHAVACRRFGIECREMGVMLLVFFPCLYCDVSDAWMLPKRWKRMTISLAGVYVELVIAALCTWLWWFSRPGLFSDLMLNLMIVCSMNTLFVNGNPLMRYDGYYVLSDLVGIPNLRQMSWQQVFGTVVHWVTGIQLYNRPARLRWRSRLLLTIYGVSALAYRVVIIFGISWMAIQFMKSNNLASLGRTYASILVALTVVGFVFQLPPIALTILRSGWRKTVRSTIGLLILAGVVGTLLFVPVPSRLTGPCVIQPLGSTSVYASIPGVLNTTREAGSEVKAGEVIAQLVNPHLEEQLVKLKSDLKLNEKRLENLQSLRGRNTAETAAIPTVEKSIAEAKLQIQQRLDEIKQLTLIAPTDGVLLPPPNIPDKKADDIRLSQWTGTPLDQKNLGASITSGTLMGLVGSPEKVEIQAYLHEYQIRQIRQGDSVAIQLRTPSQNAITGRVVEVSKSASETIPREIAITERMMVEETDTGEYRPVESMFNVRIELTSELGASPIYQTGSVCISTQWQSIAKQTVMYLSRQLAFEL